MGAGMYKRLIIFIVSIVLLAGLVFAVNQEASKSYLRSHTALFQQLVAEQPAADAVQAPTVTDQEILAALLTPEQQEALQQRPQDLASVFSQFTDKKMQPLVGESDA